MAIYYFTLTSLTGLGLILTEKKREKKPAVLYLAVCLFALTLLASLRYAIGFDYFAYRSIYDMTAALPFQDILKHYWYEPLFFALCKIFCIIGLPYQALIAAVSFFVLAVAMWFICCYCRLPWMGIYLYICLQFFAYDMNLMRQAIAVSFFLLAYPYLLDRKPVPFAILLFTGGLFHNSLWYVSPLYFLLPKKHSRKFTGCLVLLALASYLFCDQIFNYVKPLLPEKYASYQNSYFWNSSTFSYIIPAGIYGILIYLFRKRITDSVRQSVYLNSALYNFLISLFITRHFILERFAVYPFVLSLAAIPDIIASYRNTAACSGSSKYPSAYYHVMLLFLLFGGAYFLFAASKGFHHVYPYTSLLDKSLSVSSGRTI